MSRQFSVDYFTEVKLGNITGHRLIHKFGRNSAVGTSPTFISVGGTYATPVANTALEILSSSVNDDVGGGGATKVTIKGVQENAGVWTKVSEAVTLDGTTPVALANNYIRVPRMYISESESYASLSAVSGVGTITLRVSGGGATWAQIDEYATGNSAGQSQIAGHTTPSGTTGVIYPVHFSVDSTKVANVAMFFRGNADDVSTPYTGIRRMIQQFDGIIAPDGNPHFAGYQEYVGATDMGVFGSVSVGTGAISAEFWVLEIDD